MSAALEVRVLLISEDGITLELQDRIDSGGLGTIQEAVEENIASLEHSDMSLTVRDHDGVVEEFFSQAAPDALYSLIVERETTLRRQKWARVFGGLLDFPESVSFDRKDQTVSLQALAWTKLLSLASAEPVRRTFEGVIANTSTGSAVVTMSTTTGLEARDEIQITTDTTKETGTIRTVDSGTQVTLEDELQETVTGGIVTLLTPYYRNKSVEFLVELLFEEAGITDYVITVGEQPLASYPVATELSTDGLPLNFPRSIVEEDGFIRASFNPGGRFDATSPQSGFIPSSATTTGQGDWRPYLATEPSTLQAHTAGDIGTIAWDHTNGRYFTLVAVVNPDPGGTTLNLGISSGGGDVIDAFGDPDDLGYRFYYHEYCPATNRVWVSYERNDSGGGGGTVVYDVGTDTTSPHTVGVSGQLRMVQPLNRMALLDDGTLYLYNPSTQALVQTVTTMHPNAFLWTLRVWSTFAAYLYPAGGATRLRVHNKDTWVQLADYEVSSTNDGIHRYLTVFDVGIEADDGLVGIGYAGGRYFVLSRFFAGVIPYADFEGKSVGAALRDLCVATASLLTMDEFKGARFSGRGEIEAAEAMVKLETPLEQETMPVWENYRGSVKVTGSSESGDEIDALSGDSGDSAHRVEISSDFITTESLAQATAEAYFAFLGRSRRQEVVTIEEMDRLIRPLEVVAFDNKDWLVLEVETDLEDREQDLVLAEANRPPAAVGVTQTLEQQVVSMAAYVWFDAADPLGDGSGYTGVANGSDVTTWHDRSGNNRDITSDATIARPPKFWKTAASGTGSPATLPNGRPVVSTVSTGTGARAFGLLNAGSSYVVVGDWTIFYVCSKAATGTQFALGTETANTPAGWFPGNIGTSDSGTPASQYLEYRSTTGPQRHIYSRARATPTSNDYWMWTFGRDTGLSFHFFQHQTQNTGAGSDAAGSPDAQNLMLAYIARYKNNAGSDTLFQMHVCEIIVFDRFVNSGERQTVWNYLTEKWGLT